MSCEPMTSQKCMRSEKHRNRDIRLIVTVTRLEGRCKDIGLGFIEIINSEYVDSDLI